MWFFLKLWCLFHTCVIIVLFGYYHFSGLEAKGDFWKELPMNLILITALEVIFLTTLRVLRVIKTEDTHETIPPIPESKWKVTEPDRRIERRETLNRLHHAHFKEAHEQDTDKREPKN